MIHDLFEASLGTRLMHKYFYSEGVHLPCGWIDKCLDLCDFFKPKVDEYVTGNLYMNVIITHLVWPTNMLEVYK